MKTDKRNNLAEKILSGSFFAFLLFIITYRIVFRLTVNQNSDYYVHINYAKDITKYFSDLTHSTQNFPVNLSYPLWHILVYFTYKLGSHFFYITDYRYACAIVTALTNICLYLTIDIILSKHDVKRAEIISFALCFVTPIYIPWFNESLYLGQGSPVTWHNPTNLIVKPFALISFFKIAKICRNIDMHRKSTKKDYLHLSIILLLSVFAKPSYFQGIVPALGLYIIIKLIRTKLADLKEYIQLCCCFLPAFLLFIAQFLAVSSAKNEIGGIGFGWLKLAKYYSPNPWISLLLVLAFPICCILFNFASYSGKTEIQLSVIHVTVSWLEYAILYENGEWFYYGDFEWAALISYTIIWVVTTMHYFKDRQTALHNNNITILNPAAQQKDNCPCTLPSEQMQNNKKIICKDIFLMILWLTHLLCGFYYAWQMLTVHNMLF